jgi:hypothetical protein
MESGRIVKRRILLNFRRIFGSKNKEEETAMNIRRLREKSVVYILGAGASKAVIPTAPLMAQLLPEALQVLKQPIYSRGLWGDRVNRIEQFIDDFYQLNPGTLPNLEDILTQLDDAIVEGRPLSNKYNVPFLRILREDLVFAICEVLRAKLDYGEVSGEELIRRFIHRLVLQPHLCGIMRGNQEEGGRDGSVSLNRRSAQLGRSFRRSARAFSPLL